MIHPSIRSATAADLDRLREIECAVFPGDRLSRRGFRRFLAKTPARILVAELEGRTAGYALVLFRKDNRRARLYSLAVAPEHKSRGIGRILLIAAEQHAAAHNCDMIRLEVRADNGAAKLYRDAGYREFGRHTGFYQDGMDALRFEKLLAS